MKQATKKQVTIQYLTFDDLVDYGLKHSDNIVNGVPQHFKINEYSIFHENNDCYRVTTLEGEYVMTREDVLIIGIKGEIYPCKIDIFEATYDIESITNTYKMEHMHNALTALIDKGFSAKDKDGKDIDLSTFISIQGNTLKVDIQDGTIPSVGVNGIQVTDLLKYVKEIYVSLDNAYPSVYNKGTILSINSALKSQEDRTADRVRRGVEGQNKI